MDNKILQSHRGGFEMSELKTLKDFKKEIDKDYAKDERREGK